MRFHIRGRLVVVGYNAEPTLRFGIREERSFVAYGCWPLLIGVGKHHKVSRRDRKMLREIQEAMVHLTPEELARWERIADEMEAESP